MQRIVVPSDSSDGEQSTSPREAAEQVHARDLGQHSPASVGPLQLVSLGIIVGVVSQINGLSYAANAYVRIPSYQPIGFAASSLVCDFFDKLLLSLITAQAAALVQFVLTFSSDFGMPLGAPDVFLSSSFVTLSDSVLRGLPEGTSEGAAAVNILLVFILVGIMVGVAQSLVGLSQLIQIVEYIPYPICAGFLGSVGISLLNASLVISAELSLRTIHHIFSFEKITLFLPTVLTMILNRAIRARIGSSYGILASLIIGTTLFYAMLFASNCRIEDAQRAGYLFNTPTGASATSLVASMSMNDLHVADTISSSWIVMICMVLVINVKVGIGLAGLAKGFDGRIRFNKELLWLGMGNALAGLFSGPCVSHSVALMTLASNANVVKSRWIGRVSVIVCLLFFLGGVKAVAIIPRFVYASVLLSNGADVTLQWGWRIRRRLPKMEFIIVLISLGFCALVPAPFGLLGGSAVAMALCCVNVIFKFARHSAYRMPSPLRGCRSRLHRGDGWEEAVLNRAASKNFHILRLQGCIYFGSVPRIVEEANRILDTPPSYLQREDDPDNISCDQGLPLCLIVDFALVPSLEISAAIALQSVVGLAKKRGCHVVMTSARPNVRELILKSGFDSSVQWAVDLDRGFEDCENHILAIVRRTEEHAPETGLSVRAEVTERSRLYENIPLEKERDYVRKVFPRILMLLCETCGLSVDGTVFDGNIMEKLMDHVTVEVYEDGEILFGGNREASDRSQIAKVCFLVTGRLDVGARLTYNHNVRLSGKVAPDVFGFPVDVAPSSIMTAVGSPVVCLTMPASTLTELEGSEPKGCLILYKLLAYRLGMETYEARQHHTGILDVIFAENQTLLK